MKRILQIILMILLLTPSFLWLHNSRSHQLGSLKLQGEKAVYSHYARISSTSYPILHHDKLFLISISDPYIYEFEMGDQPTNINRYEIGGKAKTFLRKDDQLVIAYQENLIKNRLVSIKTFDLNSCDIEILVNQAKVRGDMASNIVAYEDGIYTWALEEDQITHIWTDGSQVLERKTGISLGPKSEAGFNLNQLDSNLPVFELSEDPGKAYLLSPSDSQELVKVEGHYDLPFLNDQAFMNLRETEEYSRFYFKDDHVLARLKSESEEWEDLLSQWIKTSDLVEQTKDELKNSAPGQHITDVFRLPNFEPVKNMVTTSYLYPESLAISGSMDFSENYDAVMAQGRVVRQYQNLLSENNKALEDYMSNHQLKDFILSPTSIFLLFAQVIMLVIGFKVLKKGGHRNDI